VGRQLYFSRQYEPAVKQFRKTLDMDPNFVPAQHAIELAYAQTGMFREAVAERQKVLTLSGNPDLAAAIGEELRQDGYPGVLQSWLEGLNEVSKRAYVSSYHIAQIHARLGEKDQAIANLERAYSDSRQQSHLPEGGSCLRPDSFHATISRIAAEVRDPVVRSRATQRKE